MKSENLRSFLVLRNSVSEFREDYRAVYDIRNSELRIVAIFHRDQCYDKQLPDERL